MPKKTIAQLEAELDQLRQENKTLRTRPARVRSYASMFANDNRRTDNDPAWTGPMRFVAEEGAEAIWLDVSMWDVDPSRFKQNPPDFSLSVSKTSPEYAAKLEESYQTALARKAGVAS